MIETAIFFYNHLQSSAAGLVWGAHQVHRDRWLMTPPVQLGTWSAARHLFHMAFYEETIALPSMRQWLGDPLPNLEGLSEEAAWDEAAGKDVQVLTQRFHTVRQAQVELTLQLSESAWDHFMQTVWDPFPLRWVVSKTLQHTAEHTSDILRLALFWDAFIERKAT